MNPHVAVHEWVIGLWIIVIATTIGIGWGWWLLTVTIIAAHQTLAYFVNGDDE